ncbi:MAG: methyltransferase family protein [Candidatus Ratteibacteria bacterium]
MRLSRYDVIKLFSNLRVSVGWLFFLLVVLIGEIRNYWPLSFVILGEIVRTTASGTIVKNEKLSTFGLYNVIRHPLYLGSLFISLGFCMMCKNPVLWIYWIIFFPICYYSAITIEEMSLSKKFGKEFLDYKKSVPAFLPIKFETPVRMKNSFSWVLVKKK